MVPHSAATGAAHPDAIEFVRFCYHRRRVGWPELYDEMCAVAGRGLFRGLSAEDLGGIGVGFSLFDMPALASLAARVIAEEMALRRPVRVVISEATSAPHDGSLTDDGPGALGASIGSSTAPGANAPTSTPLVRSVATASDERSFDVPIRLALAPAGA